MAQVILMFIVFSSYKLQYIAITKHMMSLWSYFSQHR